jgi:hypothetical protein
LNIHSILTANRQQLFNGHDQQTVFSPMLTEMVLGCDGKKPQSMVFEELFDYKGKKNLKKVKSLQAIADTSAKFSPAFKSSALIGHSSRASATLEPNSTSSVFSLLNTASLPASMESVLSSHELNIIDDVSELLGLNFLRYLNLESNLISSVEDIGLLKCCRKFRALILRGNGAEQNPDYRSEVKRLLPRLHSLDDISYDDPPEELELPPPPDGPPVAEPDFPQTAPFAPPDVGPLPPIRQTPRGLRGTTPTMARAMVSSRKIAPPVVKVWHNVGNIRI